MSGEMSEMGFNIRRRTANSGWSPGREGKELRGKKKKTLQTSLTHYSEVLLPLRMTELGQKRGGGLLYFLW